MLEFAKTISTGAVEEKGCEKNLILACHLPYMTPISDGILMLRDGELMASFTVEGICSATSDEATMAILSEAMSKLIAQQKGDVSLYIHRISTHTAPIMSQMTEGSFIEEIDNIWQDYIATIGLQQRTKMITLVIRPSTASSFLSRYFGDRSDNLRADIAKRTERLEQVVSTFIKTLSKTKPTRLTVSSGEWLGHLRSLINGKFSPFAPGAKFTVLADLIADTEVFFQKDTFTILDSDRIDKRFGAVITLKDYPSETFAGIFDKLNLPFNMVVTQSFKPTDSVSAQNRISLVRRQMGAADDAAVSLRLQLEEAEDDVASGRSTFGNHSATVTLFCSSIEELNLAVTLVSRAVQESGGVSVRESMAARAAYFSQHPGNLSYRTRPSLISSRNFSDMAALHGSPSGRPAEQSPWGDAVTILPTAEGETYRLNFHLAGALDERTVGHTLVLGQTGSGKTLGTAFLLSQAVRLNPRIIVFDKDRGFEMAIRAMGGSYSAVRMGEDTGFNPFRAETDDRGIAWLVEWISTLASFGGNQLDTTQVEAITAAVQSNGSAEPVLQNFCNFRSQLRATDDDGEIHSRLSRWDEGGQFGWLFGGKENDPLKFDNKIVGFDLTEIFDNDIVRTAWLSYVFRRIERLVEDEEPTLLVLDEAWKLLDDPYFEKRLKDWMLTLRKKNVVLILLTQRVSHINESAAGNSILESAVTRLIYPSSFNTRKELAPLSLNDNEVSFLTSSNVGNHLALFVSGEDSVVVDLDLSVLGGGLDVLGGGSGKKATSCWRDNPEFWKDHM